MVNKLQPMNLTCLLIQALTGLYEEQFGFADQTLTFGTFKARCELHNVHSCTVCAIHFTQLAVCENTTDEAIECCVVDLC